MGGGGLPYGVANAERGKRASELVIGDLVTHSNPAEFSFTVADLSPEKVAAGAEIGYESLLDIGYNTLVGPVWRMMVQQIDLRDHTVSIHGRKYPINAEEFGRVMGVRDGGSDFDLGAAADAAEYGAVVDDLCDSAGRIQYCLLEEIVRERDQVDATFRIAFALLALGLVLCPGTVDAINTSMLLPLLETGQIVKKNWASFCVKRLEEEVMNQREFGDGVVRGCVLFLQVLYFDKVGEATFHIDRSILPLRAWGEFEVRQLIGMIRTYGGFKSPIVLMERSKRSKMASKCCVDDGAFGLGLRRGVHEDIFDVKLEMMGFKNDLCRLRDVVGKLQPDMVEVTRKVEIIVQLIASQKEDCAEKVKMEMRRYLPQRRDATDGHTVPVWTPPKNGAKGAAKSILDATFELEENRYHTPNRGANQAIEVTGYAIGKAVKAVSASSSSPGAPPAKTDRKTKGEVAHSYKAVASPHARALFTYAIAHNLQPDYPKGVNYKGDGINVNKMTTVSGPYILLNPLEDDDNLLINYIFLGGGKQYTMEEGRIIVASSGNSRSILYRDEISCLGPKKLLTSFVINFIADSLNSDGSGDWFLPTYFSEKANTYKPSESFRDWVEHTRTLCNLHNGCLEDCKRMFLPMHDASDGGHWFLLVVDMENKVAEVWDSLPNEFSSANRWDIAVTTLRHLDHCFYFDKIRNKGSTTEFGLFDYVVPENVPKQFNGYDCGIYVIQNMMHYRTNWAKGAKSDDLRSSVLLYCLKSPANERAKLTLREARAFAAEEGSFKEDIVLAATGWEGVEMFEFDDIGDELEANEVAGGGGEATTATKGFSGTVGGNKDLRGGFLKGMFRD